MKTRIAKTLMVLAIGTLSIPAMMLPEREIQPPRARIVMQSAPYPLVLGSSSLSVTVTDAAGNPVRNAVVSLTAEMVHAGMLPLTARPSGYQNGAYQFAITWPMAGAWKIDVSAQLPGQAGNLRDQFDVYIYAVALDVPDMTTQFQSAADNDALIADPATEYGVIIPQGTAVQMREGHASDVIPTEIRLSISGQHTLVIQNNDFTDHTIGPFTVRAGEMIRQTFTRPTVYQGACSINDAAELSIIVEE